MRLHLYFARRFLFSFVTMLVVLGLVFVLLDMVEGMRKFDASQVGFTEVLGLTLLNMPMWMYRILPLVTILATIWMFLSLARSSELVVTRASGRSAMITLISPVVTVFLIGVVALLIFNPISAATQKKYERLSAEYSGGSRSISSVSKGGVWLRQGNKQGQIVIRASQSNNDGTRLQDVTFYSFSSDGVPTKRVSARQATLEPGRWALRAAKVWNFDLSDNPEGEALVLPAYWIATNLTEEQIRDSFGKPSNISIWDLPSFITRLKEAGFSPRLHQVWLQIELSTPLFLVAMVLIGASFTMRHTRFGRTGIMVVSALVLGFGFYFIRNFAQILGENGQIPVIFAAWTTPISGILLSLGFLLHLEDG
ncbi:LPS export ABC transporter permease LptG [Aliiroseovarius crassostreae]|uniref:LPS export ABC transporter permease LptG n=1 Tax=Aliiroseovarius crassostreae TaxID=154981 RepID=UPI0021AF5F00|nr:LPS export ABC transporter permease LptG [Aliiroseovarius crassostreae]UWP99604.1 LPS export ABC transporter permease LptG [Aliiroseovarius crassostreae]